MKKTAVILFIFFAFAMRACADTVIRIPADFLSEVARKVNFKADLNFLERLLLNQVMKNSSLNGVKLKDYNVDNLIEYFNEDELFKKIGSNKLIEPNTGAVLEFNSDGKCKNDGDCTIVADLNGDKGPNEVWTKADEPKDRMVFKLKRNDEGGIEIVIPEIY